MLANNSVLFIYTLVSLDDAKDSLLNGLLLTGWTAPVFLVSLLEALPKVLPLLIQA
jgi:hypothetical protein